MIADGIIHPQVMTTYFRIPSKRTLEPEFIDDLKVPFVKGSPVKLLCKYVNEYKIEENDCIHIIASIETIYADENLFFMMTIGCNWIEEIVAINGLDGYVVPKLSDDFIMRDQINLQLSML